MISIKDMTWPEEENWIYTSIGYYNGKIIAKDIEGDLYYLEEDEEIAPFGIALQEGAMDPIEDLPEEEQKEIRERFEDIDPPPGYSWEEIYGKKV